MRRGCHWAQECAAVVVLVVVLGCVTSVVATADDGFDRAQTIIVNLNRMAGSAGWLLLQDRRYVRDADHDLTKAIHQIEEADRTYAKLRGRPDDRFLEPVKIKLEKCLNSRAQFEEDLRDAYDQLKSSIQETIITDEERKKKRHK